MASAAAAGGVTSVPVITLDSRGWASKEDVYVALLAGLRAPKWHGHNLDALNDSLATGSINDQEPPFRVEITGSVKKLPGVVQTLLTRIDEVFADARERGRDITLKFVDDAVGQKKAQE